MKRIIKIITIVALLMIPQVKAITSDEVIYQDDTVTKALDELNICATGGDATSDEILSGKTAYVQGKLIVGTLEISGDKIAYGQTIGGVSGTYTSDADAVAGNILKDKTAYVKGELITGTIPSKGAATYTPSRSNQTISAGQYLSGDLTIKGDSHLIPEALRCGVTIFGVKGTDGCGTYKFNAKVGDYVKMTPTKTTYSIASSLTGCTQNSDYEKSGYCGGTTTSNGTQTINPSELNLWRIIKLNSDGTIEMVSEYVPSTEVYFYGQTGYKKFVGSLNTIASQYANSTYTVATRHMGFNSQTANLNVTLSAATCKNMNTEDNSLETKGCGDIGYETDVNLVKTAVGTLKAYRVNATTVARNYWIASRHFFYAHSAEYGFYARDMGSDGSLGIYYMYDYSGSWYNASVAECVRPIVTLKANVSPSSGSGTSSSPWVLP